MTPRQAILRARVDWVPALEALYAPARDDDAWMQDVLDALRPAFLATDGVGAMAVAHDPDCTGGRVIMNLSPSTVTVVPDPVSEPLFTSIGPEAMRLFFYPPAMVTTHAELEVFLGPRERAMFHAAKKEWGVKEALGIVVSPEPGVAGVVYVPTDRRVPLSKHERRVLTQFALHLENAYRLRRSPRVECGTLRFGGRASLAPAHAPAQVELHAQVKGIEEAHRSGRRSARGEPLDLWRALVAGRYSLVPRPTNGRSEYVVVENPPRSRALRALSSRESDVLASAARGVPAKLVAYGLGISAPTVSSALRSAAAKIGASSRMDLIRIAAILTQDPRMQATDATLTKAESEVLAYLREGLSNAQIAKLRARSVRTIANQVAALLRKTRSTSRRELVVGRR